MYDLLCWFDRITVQDAAITAAREVEPAACPAAVAPGTAADANRAVDL